MGCQLWLSLLRLWLSLLHLTAETSEDQPTTSLPGSSGFESAEEELPGTPKLFYFSGRFPTTLFLCDYSML